MPRNSGNRARATTTNSNVENSSSGRASGSTITGSRAKKRARPIITSDSEEEINLVTPEQRRDAASTVKSRDCTNCRVEIFSLKQRLKKAEEDKKQLERKVTAKKGQLQQVRENLSDRDRGLERLKKEKVRLKKQSEKLTKEKEEAEKQAKKWKKKADCIRSKLTKMETEKAHLESKLSNLKLQDGGVAAASGSSHAIAGPSGTAAEATGTGSLFQDMMDNFRELAESQLQCAVCSELFVEAVSVNCGHTFCHYCIGEWRKKKNNCPVCRTNIRSAVPCKVMDEYVNKVHDQFISEGGRMQRNVLIEERAKLKAAAAPAAPRGRGATDQLVNIVLNRRREEDSSLDSDDTIELHLSGNRDSDSDPFSDLESHPLRDPPRANLRTLLASIRSDTSDSEDDSDFSVRRVAAGANPRHRMYLRDDNASFTSESSVSTLSSSSESSDSEADDDTAAQQRQRGGRSNSDSDSESSSDDDLD